LGLRAKELRRLDPDDALIPTKRSPGQLVDLVSSQAGHRAQKEDLELFRVSGCEFLPCALQERGYVERRTVTDPAKTEDIKMLLANR
jgi:hypothetical protein